jgi:hypothetical protein
VFAIHKPINSTWNKKELPDLCKESIIVPIDKTDCINYRGTSLLSTSYKILSNILLSRLVHIETKLFGTIRVDFNVLPDFLH